MIHQLQKEKKALSISLLMAFSMVYVVAFLCDFGVINIYQSFDHNAKAHTHKSPHQHDNKIAIEHGETGQVNKIAYRSLLLGEEEEPTYSHHDEGSEHNSNLHNIVNSIVDDEHSTDINHHSIESTPHKHTGTNDDDDCCKDETNAIFSSLINHHTTHISMDTHYFVLYFNEPYVILSESIVDKITTAQIFHDLPPPNSGYFIRILIQSFLN